jgi:hypothetical protein
MQMTWHYNDFPSYVGKFDHAVIVDSMAAGGQDYLTITSLSARQAFGGIQIVGTQSKMYVFLKEISSGGFSQTVDVVFPAAPIFIYTNPVLLKLLLDPLFEQQETPGQWPNTYSIVSYSNILYSYFLLMLWQHDLGNYPSALGHKDGVDEYQPLEECGNMLIMTLAYAQRTNDTPYLKQHYRTWHCYQSSKCHTDGS